MWITYCYNFMEIPSQGIYEITIASDVSTCDGIGIEIYEDGE